MRTPGLEPGTSSLSATRSNQLSYARKPKILRAMDLPNFGQGILSQASGLSTLIRDFQQVLLTSRVGLIDQTGMKHERNSVCIDFSTAKTSLPRQALHTKSRSQNRFLRFCKRLLLFGNHFRLRCHFRVHLNVVFPFGGHVVLVKNGFDGAFRDASFAIDALLGVDVEHLFALIKALDRANNYAIGVSATNTGLGNNVGHI